MYNSSIAIATRCYEIFSTIIIYVDPPVTYLVDNSRWALLFALTMRKRKILERRKFIGIRVCKENLSQIANVFSVLITCLQRMYNYYYHHEDNAKQSYTLYENQRSIDMRLAAITKNNEI